MLKVALPCKWVDAGKPLQISDAAGLHWTELTTGDAKAIYITIDNGGVTAGTTAPADLNDATVYTGGGVQNMFWLGRPVRIVYGTAGSTEQVATAEKLLHDIGRWPIYGGSDMEAGRLPALKDADVDEQTLKPATSSCSAHRRTIRCWRRWLMTCRSPAPTARSPSRLPPAMSWPEGDVAFSLYYRNPLAPARRIWWFGGIDNIKTLKTLADATRYGTMGRWPRN